MFATVYLADEQLTIAMAAVAIATMVSATAATTQLSIRTAFNPFSSPVSENMPENTHTH